MKSYLKEYIKQIDELLECSKLNVSEEINNHLIKISFFQHERLIHLLVTLACAILTIVSFAISTISPMFVFVGIITLILLIPYIFHYYFLENSVQYLYKQYDRLLEKQVITK